MDRKKRGGRTQMEKKDGKIEKYMSKIESTWEPGL